MEHFKTALNVALPIAGIAFMVWVAWCIYRSDKRTEQFQDSVLLLGTRQGMDLGND